eukprot:scpid82566/ scgid13764/ 
MASVSAGLQDELELLRREICSGALLRCPDGLDPLLQCRRPPSSVRILIVGSYGTGKSAYINSVYKALYSAQLMPAYTQDPSAEGTFFLDEYIANDASPVSFLDMRGQYEWFDETEIREIRNIVLGFIRPGTCLLRGVELQMLTDEELTALKDGSSVLGKADRIERLRAEDVPVSDQVHGVIFTFAKYETPLRSPENPRFLELLDEIAPLRDFIKDNGIDPVCLVTHMDNMRWTEERANQTQKQACKLLELKEENIFTVTNYTEVTFHEPSSVQQDLAILKPLKAAIKEAGSRYWQLVAQGEHQSDAKVQAESFPEDVARGRVGGDVPVSSLFRALQPKYQWQPAMVRDAINKLEEQDIVTASLLREYWQKEPFKRASIPEGYHRPLQELLGIS